MKRLKMLTYGEKCTRKQEGTRNERRNMNKRLECPKIKMVFYKGYNESASQAPAALIASKQSARSWRVSRETKLTVMK
jgi:hypothetical protein